MVSKDPRQTADGRRDYNRHAYASYLLVWDAAEEWVPDHARLRAAQIVGGHHGVVPMPNNRLDRRTGGGLLDVEPPDQARRGALTRLLATREDIIGVTRLVTGGQLSDLDWDVAPAAISLAVVVLADWVASQTWFIQEQAAECGLEVDDAEQWHAVAFRRAAKKALIEAGLVRPTPRRVSAAALVPSGKEPSGLQRDIGESHPAAHSGITFIKAPTGDGKTEAALIAASRYAGARGTAGWFFAMPTRGTADGLFGRLERLLPLLAGPRTGTGMQLRRVHGMAKLHEVADHAGNQARAWLSGSRKALLAPHGVGTIDQVLMGAIRAKHSPLRMLGAGLGCLIVDEAHSYDWYMGALLDRTVAWMGALGTPVVVLSATLPQNRIEALAAAYQNGAMSHQPTPGRPEAPPPVCGYPGWVQWSPASDGPGRWSAGSAAPKRPGWTLHISISGTTQAETDREMARAATSAVADGGCVLVVRETVAKAQQTYKAVTEQTGETCETLLLHSRFRHRDRARIEEALARRLGPPTDDGNRPARLIAVATQVVEMSLDVDFDTVITDPAPLGALIQRAGRSHRHDRAERPAAHRVPRLRVFWPTREDGSPEFASSPVYMEHDLRRSHELISAHPQIAVPEDVPGLVDQAADTGLPDDGEDAWIEWMADADVQRGQAKAGMIPDPGRKASRCLHDVTSPRDEDHIVPTRLGVPTVLVLPVHETDSGLLSAEPGGPPLPQCPTAEEEQRLVAACVPVPAHLRQKAWLDQLSTHSSSGDNRRTAWTSGPLAEARLLTCRRGADGTDASIGLRGWQIEISPTVGLVATPEQQKR